jgi:hypothetical protein
MTLGTQAAGSTGGDRGYADIKTEAARSSKLQIVTLVAAQIADLSGRKLVGNLRKGAAQRNRRQLGLGGSRGIIIVGASHQRRILRRSALAGQCNSCLALWLAVVGTAARASGIVGVEVMRLRTGYTLNTVLALGGRQSFTLGDGTGLVAVAVTEAGSDQTDERATTNSDPKLGMGHGESSFGHCDQG